jgi:hypothetical protein
VVGWGGKLKLGFVECDAFIPLPDTRRLCLESTGMRRRELPPRWSLVRSFSFFSRVQGYRAQLLF